MLVWLQRPSIGLIDRSFCESCPKQFSITLLHKLMIQITLLIHFIIFIQHVCIWHPFYSKSGHRKRKEFVIETTGVGIRNVEIRQEGWNLAVAEQNSGAITVLGAKWFHVLFGISGQCSLCLIGFSSLSKQDQLSDLQFWI